MKIAIIQAPLVWESTQQNQDYFAQKIAGIDEAIDLIVLPEMFSTGFTMHPQRIAQGMSGETVQWMQQLAQTRNCAITGSVVIEQDQQFFNRLLFVFPSGEIEYYDKRHLFTLAGENRVYTKGRQKLIVNYKGFRICPLICYDLRFPVFSRNAEDYDVLIYVANWPKPRILAWDALLKARAIENMCYVVGVNRVGTDDNFHEYNGHSQVVDCIGNYLLEPEEKEGVYVTTISKETLLEVRKKLAFLDDKDTFTVTG